LRVLYLATWYPFPPDNGARLRTYHLLKGLARQHRVTLFAFYDAEQEPSPNQDAEGMCERIVALPRRIYQPKSLGAIAGFLSSKPRFLADTFEPHVLELLEEESAGGYDMVIAGELGMAVYAAELTHTNKIFDELQLGFFADLSRTANHVGRARNKLMWLKYSRYIQFLVRKFRAVTVVSAVERERLAALGVPASRVFVVPNGVELESASDALIEPFTLIYNGAVTYYANYDAMCYFVREILPKIRGIEPRARLKITGRADQVAQNALAEDNVVSFTGYVEDVRALVRSSAVCVVPLRQGGGTRLKILEAMAVGTPVVSTTKGAEGLAVRDGVHLLIADSPDEFAAATVELLTSPELRQRLTRNALALVKAEYDWRMVQDRFDEMIATVCSAS
jgi:glycosyltransferase involved in cell wall biosynthesis